MTIRATAIGALIAVLLVMQGRAMEATIAFLGAVAAGALLDFVVRSERRKDR